MKSTVIAASAALLGLSLLLGTASAARDERACKAHFNIDQSTQYTLLNYERKKCSFVVWHFNMFGSDYFKPQIAFDFEF